MKKLTILLAGLCILLAVPVVKAAETEPTVKTAAISEDVARAELDKAVAEFNSLSSKEKKNRFKEVKKVMKQYKADKKAGKLEDADTSLILLAILAILLPPLAIYLKERNLTWKFWVSAGLLVTGIIILSALPFLWVASAALALLVVFDIL
jgi:uncharacterized membrane protein YqaE (UPF0057 family)